MKDYRLPENRLEYFTALYKMNLEHGVMPGLVYSVMPFLVNKYHLDHEQRLWLTALNGNSQHIITSWRIFKEFPNIPKGKGEQTRFREWFNANWHSLPFDSDRKYGKKLLPDFVESYSALVGEFGSQEALLTGSFKDIWDRVITEFVGFGRLTTYSYLEYVQIMSSIGCSSYGSKCDRLFFEDKSGSRSHRNGMFFLLGMDDYVCDKRQPNSHDGNYGDMQKLSDWLTTKADEYIKTCGIEHKDVGYFTLESNLCTTKNHYFARRHPGCYADMFQDRIEWYDNIEFENLTKVFKEFREDNLPEWMRRECEAKPMKFSDRSKQFSDTGFPHRGEYFL